MHENDCRDAGVDDLGNSRGEDHVDDDGVHIVAPRCLHHALAETTIRRHAGEGRHDGRQRPLDGGIEMLSFGEWFEREAGGFDPFADAAMTENPDLGAAGRKRPGGRQLRWDVAATVHDREENLHRASPECREIRCGQERLGHQQHSVGDVVDGQPAVEPNSFQA